MSSVYRMMAEQAVEDAKREPGEWFPVGIDCDQVTYNADEGTYTVAFNGDSEEEQTAEDAVKALINMWRQNDSVESDRGYDEMADEYRD